MRPRKRVLLYCADELRASRMTFVLGVRGLDATACDSPELVLHELDFAAPPFDAVLVLAASEQDRCEAVVERIKARPAAPPVALVLRHRWLLQTQADVILLEDPDTGLLLERLKALCARRRGPRPPHGVLDASRESKCAAVPA